ncbi:MAG: glucose-6-phosphate isomerase [Spirochaetaceae bacterium]|nr:MAG: glucose-6-phosphate isomerase [Spirochaetaceae bacterium]
MSVAFRNLNHSNAWESLRSTEPPRLADVLDRKRIDDYRAAYRLPDGATLDYRYAAKQVADSTIDSLQALADDQQIIDKYRMILDGEPMNTGEDRMVLHHLCRSERSGAVIRNGRDYGAWYAGQRKRFASFAEGILSGALVSTSGRPFESVVQIGIGGSDLGPRALYVALAGHEYRFGGTLRRGPMLTTRFVSNVDPDDASAELHGLDPQSTLFILVSKSGTTQETLTNEAFALRWLRDGGIARPRKHVVCVTSETSPLAKSTDYLDSFFIDDFIGGRYSSSSAVGGVVLSLAYGPDVFAELLAGAAAADAAALDGSARANPALIDALLGVYERNVLGYPATAVLPYSQALLRFPAHLQQLDMESNGKRVNRSGEPVDYATGPVIFGEPGTNGQHSFYQLLHQGTDVVPLQFIGFAEPQRGDDVEFEGSSSQRKLNANLTAQIVAFAVGKDDPNPNKRFPGGRPSSLLWARRLTPTVLGALLAHFENKVMFQGLLWNVNSFDQEGVQLGKLLTNQILSGADLPEALAGFVDALG